MAGETGEAQITQRQEPRARVKRRGILAAAAATVAALVTHSGTETKVAADGGTWTLPYNSGSIATSSTLIYLINGGSGMALFGNSSSNIGIYGSTSAGVGGGQAGVFGYGGNAGNYGVWGSSPDGTGVYGYSFAGSGNGVIGFSSSSYGVYGISNINHAVFGFLGTSTAGKAGVFGYGDGNGTYGVYGFNSGSGSIGVRGKATGGYGVVGDAAAGDAAALYGNSSSANTPAFAGYNGAAGGLAGAFQGNVYIIGNSTATGTKSAAVPHPDGSNRLLYCVESPEAWFEDFGEGTLTAGKAEVKLDPDFAAVVDTRTLHVFCMPHDASHHLAVTTRRADGFMVDADVGATAAARGVKAVDVNGTFTWRVVAKRKDVQAPRLAKVDLPTVPAPPPPPPPEPKPKLPPLPTSPRS